ncbi:MAG: hypothetical protein ABI451_12940, partial [Dokdonella sp.]
MLVYMRALALAAFVTMASAEPIASADAAPWDDGFIEQVSHVLAAPVKQTWSAWGGSIGVRWNNDLFHGMGITTRSDGPIAKSDPRRHQWFALRESGGLEFAVANGSLRHFNGGSLQMRGGYVLHLRDGSNIDLRDATFRVRAGDTSKLDLVSSDGNIWLYTDRIMFELSNREQTMAIRAADLRIMPALAARIGDPKLADLEVGDVTMNTEVYVAGNSNLLDPDLTCDPYPWPGVAVPDTSDTYKVDLFMKSIYVSPAGCQQALAGGNCDGPGGATNGFASLVPSATLVNNRNDGSAVATIPGDPLGTSSALYAANIPWYTMFGRYNTNPPINAPYYNDQHPYLIWNLYRVAADGSIDQIGRSGVKHAFLTINQNCSMQCASYNPSHEVALGCEDTYGTSNNDQTVDMGPRSEILPASGIWGRCGSIWNPLTGDAPGTCTGSYNTSDPNNNTTWTQRMLTRESQLDPSANPNATYYFESWYAVRDDIDIYNSMATMTGVPTWNLASHNWAFYSQANYRLGPAIDRWVSPTAPPANAKSAEIFNSEGHAKVAVKATDLGGGNWRYDYAVMNLDFARGL